MPYEIRKYKCSNCNKEFTTYKEAYEHELKCNKCNLCSHAYYVYGCEFECDYKYQCSYPTYRKFEDKND